jgi:Flp pilus assembly protein TadD
LDPNASVPRFHLGMVLLRIGRTREAIAHLKHAAHTDVRSPVLHHALGLAYWSQGARRRAEHQFRSALHLLPSYAPAARSLAHLLILSGRSKEAVAILAGHLTLSADNDAVRDLLGYALFEQKDYRHAIEQLKITFNLMTRQCRGDSDLARVANNIGVSYARLRDWKNAEAWYGRAADLDKSQPEAHRNLARAYLETNSAERVVSLLEAFRRRKDDSEAAFLLALAKNNLGRSQEAIAELERLVDRDEAPGAVFSLLGTLLADEADAPARAVAVLQEGFRRFPTDPMVANNLAYALLLADRDAEARKVLEQYREPSTADVYLRATWGLLHLHEGDLEQGMAGYSEAQRLAQTQGQRDLARQAKQKMHLELARYFLKHGNTEAAAKEVTFGLATPGKAAYERLLTQIQRSLPGPS